VIAITARKNNDADLHFFPLSPRSWRNLFARVAQAEDARRAQRGSPTPGGGASTAGSAC